MQIYMRRIPNQDLRSNELFWYCAKYGFINVDIIDLPSADPGGGASSGVANIFPVGSTGGGGPWFS